MYKQPTEPPSLLDGQQSVESQSAAAREQKWVAACTAQSYTDELLPDAGKLVLYRRTHYIGIFLYTEYW